MKFVKNRSLAIFISLAIVAVLALVVYIFVYPPQEITIAADKDFYVTSTLGLLTATVTITSPADDEITIVPVHGLPKVQRIEILENGKWNEINVSDSAPFSNWEKVSLKTEGLKANYSEPLKAEGNKPIRAKILFKPTEEPSAGEFHVVVFSRSGKAAHVTLKYEIREPLLKERGFSYETFDNYDGSFTYRTGGVPLWTFDEQANAYKPFVNRDNADGSKEIRNGRIGVKFSGEDAQLFDVNGTELKVSDEDWILLRDGQGVDISSTGSDTAENSTHIVHTRYYSSEAGKLNISYIFREGEPLKHDVRFSASQDGVYQLVQRWKGINFDETIEQDATEGVKVHDHKTEKKIKKTKSENLPEDLEFRKDDKLVIHEITSSAINEFEEFEADSELKQLKFVWGRWNLKAGEGFVLDPDTFTSSSPSANGAVRTNGAAPTCSSTTDASDSSMIAQRAANSGTCWKSYVQWSTADIPNSAVVSSTVFKFEINIVSNGINCDVASMVQNGAAPSGMSTQQLWDEITDGTSYVSNDATCTTEGTNKQLTLGSQANTDLQNKLSADWFAVGHKLNSDTFDGTSHQANIKPTAATPNPTLEVTYTIPNAVPRFADNNTYQSTTLSATNTYTYSSTLNISASVNVTDTDGDLQIDTVIFGINGTGNITNKNITGGSFKVYNKSVGGQFYVNLSSLAVGTYTAFWWANDSSNAQNQTANFTITINRAGTLSQMLLNGTRADSTYERNAAANFTATINISGKTANIDTNITGWSVQSGTDSVTNVSTLTSTGKFNITGYFVGDANYSASSETFYATVSDTTVPTITVQQPTNTTYYTASVWANVTLNEAGSWCGRSLDSGSNVTMTNSSGNWNNQMTSLSELAHNARVYCNDTSGNMAAGSAVFFTVNSPICYTSANISQYYACSSDTTEFSPAKSSGIYYLGDSSGFLRICKDVSSSDNVFNVTATQTFRVLVPLASVTCSVIGNQGNIISKQGLPSSPFGTYALSGSSKLQMSLQFDRILLNGTAQFGAGQNKICIEKVGRQGSNALVNVRAC